ncbi:MAG: extracellular solute-binding protein [Chloroflexi bacterium]|nr:MAG: extracellular solute-binding protein [Chloroflexota bacterium]TMF19945.1 MAG: extracellular solute-binding protein [Chloroflexota bacterium]TMF98802.1 MAG: extracellular solute-binding protein [Chloroflexota bacterium]
MRLRKPWVTVASVAVALIAAACGGSSSETNNPSSQTGTLTVWLMNGSAPQTVIDEVNADFKVKYPNVTVKVEIQQWGDIGTKLDTAFGGSTPPDVVELGNTLVAKYAAAGALEDITGKKTSFDNASTWLQSLTDSCTQNGKLYCVPYYAGSRAIIYRKDFFASAGVTPPDSLDSLLTAGQKLMAAHSSDPNFSALYFPGKYWYAALPFVWDFGGDIATQSGGKWQGSLNSSSAQQGLTTLSTLVSSLSRADKTGDEAKQDAAFAQGHVAMIIANGWEVGVILDPKAGNPALKDQLGAFPIPSHNAGQSAPVFLGGSDLGIAAKSKHVDLANAWVQMLTGNKHMAEMATVGGVIPNNTSMLNLGTGINTTFYNAAKNSKFVPNSQNWAGVENANVLPDMLVKIFTKQQSIPDATKAASDRITTILNGGG